MGRIWPRGTVCPCLLYTIKSLQAHWPCEATAHSQTIKICYYLALELNFRRMLANGHSWIQTDNRIPPTSLHPPESTYHSSAGGPQKWLCRHPLVLTELFWFDPWPQILFGQKLLQTWPPPALCWTCPAKAAQTLNTRNVLSLNSTLKKTKQINHNQIIHSDETEAARLISWFQKK